MSSERPTGPVEDHEWAERLRARVVTPEEPALVHGYPLDSDLAIHYSLVDLAYLALTGSLPAGSESSRLFESGLMIAAPITVAEAPTHSGMLVKLCGAPASSAIAAGAMVLTEQVNAYLALARPMLGAIAAGERIVVPEPLRAASAQESTALEPWRARFPPALGPLFDQRAGRLAVALAALVASGVHDENALCAALVWARAPLMMAEILAQAPLAFGGYPMDKPEFVYEEGSK